MVSCVAAPCQEGFFCMVLINIDYEDANYRTGSSSKEGRRLWEDIRVHGMQMGERAIEADE